MIRDIPGAGEVVEAVVREAHVVLSKLSTDVCLNRSG